MCRPLWKRQAALVALLSAAVGCGDGGDDQEPPRDTDTDSDSGGEPSADGGMEGLLGVSLAGADFGSALPGDYGVDYIYPEAGSAEYFIEKGMNIFRIPFRWERLQRELSEPFDEDEAGRLTEVVSGITDQGANAILDPHNYARYHDQLLGTDVDAAHLADFWSRLATLFMDDPKVVFGLMNEPHDMETEAWLEVANEAIAAIRETGAENLILVPGNGWTGAHSWSASYYGTPNAAVMTGVEDPGDNFAFEVHQYLDEDSSGSGSVCVSETVGSERIEGFTDWAAENGYRAFLGEFGSDDNDTCLAAVDDMLTFIEDNDDVWLGWTWWAAGPWWGGYFMSIEPSGGNDKPQMETLSRHL
jgi:endoglucanase